MKIWDVVLSKLATLPKTLSSINTVIEECFNDNIFCEEYIDNKITTTTYDEIFKQSLRVASFILDEYKNATANETIFLQSKNSKNWVITFWGILKSGYVPALVDPEMNREHFEYIRDKLNPKLIINDENITKIVDYKERTINNNTFANSFILLSSGTTDLPKIVEFNGESVYAQLLLAKGIIKKSKLISNFKRLDQIKLLMFLPLHHVFGLMANYLWFTFFGVKFIFLNSMSHEAIQEACQRHGVTHFLGVPLIWEILAKKIWLEAQKQNKSKTLSRTIKFTNFLQSIFPTRFSLWLTRKIFKHVRQQILGNALTFLITGGASINQDTLKLMNGIGYALHQGYGMTETGIISVELSNYANKRNLLSVGKPFKNIKWRINNDGILELKGAMLSKRIISKDKIIELDADKWFTTNDIFIHKNGRLQMLGRNDDMIISLEGIKIDPEEIERRFEFDNNIRCVIIPVRQHSGYDKIILIVGIPTNTKKVLIDQITYKMFKTIKELPINKKPRDVFFTNELPLTNLGKVKRNIVKTTFINTPEIFNKVINDVSLINANKQYSMELLKNIDIVRKCFADIFNLELNQINERTDFILDLGGTSLDYYSLMNKISIVTSKEIKLVENKVLTTPLDFALLLTQNKL